MSPMIRYGFAAAGMVLLVGLAFYQGGMEPTESEQKILSGTAISEIDETEHSEEAVENHEPECQQSTDSDEAGERDCKEQGS
ncbi:MAG: hypothetical protein HKN57_13245 [Xanthomonadales bacterium]|nr:hypothetical protein [Gammaproteobacteria bacterium]MBT8054159.1 hypothetical protein [Gammaproteobacteria bacterium]NND58204.1 hypothetical protein [Xanthomonadales bacterium]NNK52498.1 hypothetical protein [Xanthomonadales bacterium]